MRRKGVENQRRERESEERERVCVCEREIDRESESVREKFLGIVSCIHSFHPSGVILDE